MSIWEFSAMVEEYARAHDTDEDKALTEEEREELAQWMGI